MLSSNKSGENVQPFSITRRPGEVAREVDPTKAKEVKPFSMKSSFDFTNQSPLEATEDEAEATADNDPKVLSATSNVEVSENDSLMSSLPLIPTPESIHPSSLPPVADDPVSAEKELKRSMEAVGISPLIPLMNLGLSKPSVEAPPSEEGPVVTSSFQDGTNPQ